MLTKIAAKNYKNLDLAEGINLSNLNILVGPNGSGKSNLIALIEFLKNCLSTVDSNRGVTAFEDAVYRLGGAKILDGRVGKPAVVSLTYEGGGHSWKFSLSLYVQNSQTPVNIKDETLSSRIGIIDPLPVYHRTGSHLNASRIYSRSNLPKTKSVKYQWVGNTPYALVSTGHTIPINKLALKLEDTHTKGISDRLKKLSFLLNIPEFTSIYNANDMELYKIRTTEPKIGSKETILSRSGDNLARVLDNFYQKSFDFEDDLNKFMQAILPTVRRVRPTRVGRLSLTIEWYVTGVSEPFYLDEMSDGTVRMLCWATLLLSPELPKLLVIEEPELGIHVAWLPILADWIKQAAERTQVIISTHSPDLLNHFSDRVENVYVFHPTVENKNRFKVKQLLQQDVDSWFQEGWQLGDLYRVGDPSVGGWPW
ncbi:AAA family ATPase [Anaerolineales bacterium HSG6]|nr:AAA family ATPase [Anaerolineales bacterium HSG6]